MVVGMKDAAKLFGMAVVAFCAALVCTMFLNFYLDILGIEEKIVSEQALLFYEAQVLTAKVVCMVSGGCLLMTSAVMLLFYVKRYMDAHKKELGILKALGYSNLQIAGHFWVFGAGVLFGAGLGFCGAFLLMPKFYKMQNQEGILPELAVSFHPALFFGMVMLPAVSFSVLAICFAWHKLRRPVMALLQENPQDCLHAPRRRRQESTDGLFLNDLKKSTLRSRKTLVFFILFASFCFSAMIQMSASMKDLSSVMIGAMVLLIGLTLACTTLFLAVTTVVGGNAKTIAMMRAFGYSQKECCRALLGGYRPLSYLGFALGTAYQYALLRIMVDLVFADVPGVPVYEFDLPMLLLSLAAFCVLYEALMRFFAERIRKISLKEIMLA